MTRNLFSPLDVLRLVLSWLAAAVQYSKERGLLVDAHFLYVPMWIPSCPGTAQSLLPCTSWAALAALQ